MSKTSLQNPGGTAFCCFLTSVLKEEVSGQVLPIPALPQQHSSLDFTHHAPPTKKPNQQTASSSVF